MPENFQIKQNASEIEDYFSKISKIDKKSNIIEKNQDSHQKNSAKNKNLNAKDAYHASQITKPGVPATKTMEHSKSREKIMQQAFFSNINNSYGSLTSQKNQVPRNVSSSGIISTPNNEKNFSGNIGVSYNVSSVRSPATTNFSLQNQNQRIRVSHKY